LFGAGNTGAASNPFFTNSDQSTIPGSRNQATGNAFGKPKTETGGSSNSLFGHSHAHRNHPQTKSYEGRSAVQNSMKDSQGATTNEVDLFGGFEMEAETTSTTNSQSSALPFGDAILNPTSSSEKTSNFDSFGHTEQTAMFGFSTNTSSTSTGNSGLFGGLTMKQGKQQQQQYQAPHRGAASLFGSSATATPSNSSPSGYFELVKSQRVNGFWEMHEVRKFARSLQLDTIIDSDVSGILEKPVGDHDVVATLWSLAILMERFSQNKSQWQLCVRKAKRSLQAYFTSHEIDNIVNQLQALVKA